MSNTASGVGRYKPHGSTLCEMRRLRVAQGLTLQALANAVGSHMPTIHRMERNGKASKRLANAVAAALDVLPEELLPQPDLPPDATAPVPTPEDAVQALELRELVSRVLATLTPREELVLRMINGLDGRGGATLDEVGAVLDVHRERVRQLEARALRKLRHPARSKKLRIYVDPNYSGRLGPEDPPPPHPREPEDEEPEDNAVIPLRPRTRGPPPVRPHIPPPPPTKEPLNMPNTTRKQQLAHELYALPLQPADTLPERVLKTMAPYVVYTMQRPAGLSSRAWLLSEVLGLAAKTTDPTFAPGALDPVLGRLVVQVVKTPVRADGLLPTRRPKRATMRTKPPAPPSPAPPVRAADARQQRIKALEAELEALRRATRFVVTHKPGWTDSTILEAVTFSLVACDTEEEAAAALVKGNRHRKMLSCVPEADVVSWPFKTPRVAGGGK